MILVFGAGGFIGSYLLEAMAKENLIAIASDKDTLCQDHCDSLGFRFIPLDITNKAAFADLPQEGVDAIVHLASMQPANVSQEDYDPGAYIRVNVIGTLNILEYCRSTGVPQIVYAFSHRAVQGLWKEGRVIFEDDLRAIKYTGEYAMFSISESAAVDCVKHFSEEHHLRSVLFRLPPVYGYGPHTEIYSQGKPVQTGFKIFLENALAGKPINVWGDCQKGRDIVYIKDVVAALIRALSSKSVSGLYNIASGRLLPLQEEVEKIVEVFSPPGSPSTITYQPDKDNGIEPFLYDISKAHRDLGWSPKYSFEEMLRDYKTEMESKRFDFLVKKRTRMLTSAF